MLTPEAQIENLKSAIRDLELPALSAKNADEGRPPRDRHQVRTQVSSPNRLAEPGPPVLGHHTTRI